MDVAREAYVRHLALDRWRDLRDLQDTLGLDVEAAVREAARFIPRPGYAALWRRRWEEVVLPAAATADAGALFGAVERAVALALEDEEAERRARGDRPLAEDPDFKGFLDWAYNQLLRQAAEGVEPA